MLQLILAGVWFSLWALYIIITYYSTNFSSINHIEVATGFSWYLISLIVVYVWYKIYSIFFSGKRVIKYNFFHIFWFSLLHYLILCISYTSVAQSQLSALFGGTSPSSIILFTHSLWLLLYPILLVVIVRSLWATILNQIIEGWKNEPLRLRFPVEVTSGFFLFSSSLLMMGCVGLYTLTWLLVLLAIIIVISIPWIIQTYNEILKTSASFDNHNLNWSAIQIFSPRLLSVEIAFILVSFLIGVSLINAIRPMPIGWDDLGAYMNFPKIMALSWEYIQWAWMYAWQIITGTGYLFSYIAAQAFYVNQLWGILAVITITAWLSLIFEEKNKKYLLSLPLILAAIFYAMPMNIFQQAKDMKLDPALLFISISAFLLLFASWREWNSLRKNLSLIGLAGILVGFAFSVKFTTLMLIMGWLWFITYRKLSIFGFFGFFFLFLALFTQFGLWKIMNVWMPTDNPWLITTASLTLTFLGVISLGISYVQFNKQQFKEMILGSLVFIFSIVIWLSPWLVKNLTESKPWEIVTSDKSVIINAALNWSGGNLNTDFLKIYTPEEYKKREDSAKNAAITSDWKSQNEDLWRYFGYEKWLNNYLLLPANLTFQKNQSWEFTEITFIFLAFIPAILLFVRWRKWLYAWWVALLLGFMFLYYFSKAWNPILLEFFWKYELPVWYAIILVFNIIFLIFSHYWIEKNTINSRLKEIIITLGVYWFLFWISAFGIVWYGILVYFLFLALIGLAAMNFVSYDEKDESDADLLSVKVTITLIFVIFILTYFIRSALPHGWNNLKEASYNEFKYKILNQEEAIFAYRQDYVTPIATLNVANLDSLMKNVKSQATAKELITLFSSDKLNGIGIRDFSYILFSLSNTKNLEVAADAKKLWNMLYKSILYPDKSIRNEWGIYRIGTFMTYLIDRNRQRYYDDSLVFSFETYFYDKSPEVTIDRMKKLWIKYLLVDLNAATIDKDPRHVLTTRFEHLLHTMKARNLKLVDTDNLCLRFAIDMYKNGNLQTPDSYIDIAWTNSESYRTESWSEVSIWRWQKQGRCFNLVLKTLHEDNDALAKYPYLTPVKESVEAEQTTNEGTLSQDKLRAIFSQHFSQSWFALFEVYDAPAFEPNPVTEAASSLSWTTTVMTWSSTVPIVQ